VPLTNNSLDLILGYNCKSAEYTHYFEHFHSAQSNRVVKETGDMDDIKKRMNWRINVDGQENLQYEFETALVMNDIPAVKLFEQRLAAAGGGALGGQGYGEQGIQGYPSQNGFQPRGIKKSKITTPRHSKETRTSHLQSRSRTTH
jgi:hypothetical protein